MPRANRRVVYEAPVNTDQPVDLVQELNDFCDRTGMKKKEVIELALRQFLAAKAQAAAPTKRGR